MRGSMKRNFAFLLSAALSGCAAITGVSSRYPSSWPPLAPPAGDCVDISGEFDNHGAYSYASHAGSPFLTYALGLPNPGVGVAALDAIDTVRIHPLADGVLSADALSNGSVVASHQLRAAAGDFTCAKGALALRPISTTKVDGWGVDHESRSFYFWRAVDGSIVGEERSSGAAVIFVVPLAGRQVFWYRWQAQGPHAEVVP